MVRIKCKHCKREGFKFKTHGSKSRSVNSLEHKTNCFKVRNSKKKKKKKNKNEIF